MICVYIEGKFTEKWIGIHVHPFRGEFPDINTGFNVDKGSQFKAECCAIYMALKTITDLKHYFIINIFTRTKYLIDVFSTWICKWALNEWKIKGHEIKDVEYIKPIWAYLSYYGKDVRFNYYRNKNPINNIDVIRKNHSSKGFETSSGIDSEE